MIDSLEILQRRQFIFDSGPMYNEFHHDAMIHEPWNALSSLAFFIPVIYWLIVLNGKFREHKIFLFILPLLFLNGLGSTLFHAFRSHQFFLILDWLPASIMSITVATYFWTLLLKKWYFGLITVFGFYGLGTLVIELLRGTPALEEIAPNIGYFFVGCAMFLPLCIHLFRTKFKYAYIVFLSMAFLGGALLFRTLDFPTPNPLPELLPQGTHFLWHIMSSFAVFSLGYYIYYSKSLEINRSIIPMEKKVPAPE